MLKVVQHPLWVLATRAAAFSLLTLSLSLFVQAIGEISWAKELELLACEYHEEQRASESTVSTVVGGVAYGVVCRVAEAFKLLVPLAGAFAIFGGGKYNAPHYILLVVAPIFVVELLLVAWDSGRLIVGMSHTVMIQIPVILLVYGEYCFLAFKFQTITFKHKVKVVLLSIIPFAVIWTTLCSFSWLASRFLLASSLGKIFICFALPALFTCVNSLTQFVCRVIRYIYSAQKNVWDCNHVKIPSHLKYPRTLGILISQSSTSMSMSCILRFQLPNLYSIFWTTALSALADMCLRAALWNSWRLRPYLAKYHFFKYIPPSVFRDLSKDYHYAAFIVIREACYFSTTILCGWAFIMDAISNQKPDVTAQCVFYACAVVIAISVEALYCIGTTYFARKLNVPLHEGSQLDWHGFAWGTVLAASSALIALSNALVPFKTVPMCSRKLPFVES